MINVPPPPIDRHVTKTQVTEKDPHHQGEQKKHEREEEEKSPFEDIEDEVTLSSDQKPKHNQKEEKSENLTDRSVFDSHIDIEA